MSKTNTLELFFRDLIGKPSTFSHSSWDITLKLINVYILEMEDVLFHHNSAVMMPENPKGKSSYDGTPNPAVTKDQQLVSGISALALVFREIEFDPDKRLLITGHTDTSGGYKVNFELSDLRAQNVLYLLTGDQGEWAKNCYGRHKVEDYQQILTYVFRTRKWPCHPGKIDDAWGDKTEKATKTFISSFNTEFVPAHAGANPLDPDLLKQVKSDSKKRWPVELWEAVYQLYSEDLCKTLDEDPGGLDAMRMGLFFVDDSKPFLGCGESFPIDQAQKNNYRSQANRRVEILLFDKDEVPVINCPEETNRKHVESECPIWHKYHFQPAYITPNDLTAVVYHISFQFFNRIENAMTAVPDGLAIRAFENGTEELDTESKWKNGVYYLKVQFKSPLNDGTHKSVHFEFETETRWVYTEKKGATPSLVTKDPATIRKMSWDDRLHYYDLPAEWSSRNYWTRYGGDPATGERFKKVFGEILTLKPIGTGTTQPSAPLMFSLDDIVLVDHDGNQNINNPAGDEPQDLDETGAMEDLSVSSRITLFQLLEKKEFQLEICSPRPDAMHFSEIVFKENLIKLLPEKEKIPRLVAFCNGFYDITCARTTRTAKLNFDKKHILGARAAVLDDDAVHNGAEIHVNLVNLTAPYDYVQFNCGNYELHYLHECGVLNNVPLSYLLIYWNCRYVAFAAAGHGPTDANWAANWMREGTTNSMERTNRPYLFKKKSGTKDVIIRPYAFYEGKLDTRGSTHICTVEISRDDEDKLGPKTAKFGQGSYQESPNYYGADAAHPDLDGTVYAPLFSHHEMGHATGLWDDYLYDLQDGNDVYAGIPRFEKPLTAPGGPTYTAPGGPYSLDWVARMCRCRSPRMRDYWHFVNWINDEAAVGKALEPFLGDNKYKIEYTFTKAGTPTTLELDLADPRYRNTCEPSHKNEGFTFSAGSTGRADLLLYRLGGGETAQQLEPHHVFDGILVVRTKLALGFVNDRYPWTKNWQENWIKEHLQKPIEALNFKWYLESHGANDFKKTFLLFVPQFAIYTVAPPGDSHFNIFVKFHNHGADARRGDFVPAGKLLMVDNDVDLVHPNALLSYIFGKRPAGNLQRGDFKPVSDWLGTGAVANDIFALRDY